MPYNITGIANSSGFLEFVQLVNTELMSDTLGIMILVMISGVLFTSFIFTTNNPRKSAAATFVISFILCLLLRAIGLVPDLAIFVTLILAGVSVAFTRKD